ncbi:ATP-binding cassette domain-containing protein, partial [Domibacillus sp. 8LH]
MTQHAPSPASPAAGPAPLLEVADLSVSIGGMPIINKVSLTLNEGEVVGLVGESGSGKSVSSLA